MIRLTIALKNMMVFEDSKGEPLRTKLPCGITQDDIIKIIFDLVFFN